MMSVDKILEIGGLRFGFRPASPEATCRFTPPFAAFLSDGAPDVVLDVHRGPPPPLSDAGLRFDTDSAWCMIEANGGVALCASAYEELAERDELVFVMTSDFRRGALYYNIEGRQEIPYVENPLVYPLGQVLVTQLLAARRGMLLHASGVVDGGRAYCFAGESGRGKSTMASLWEGQATILNDDRIVLRAEGDTFWIYGTPWHGAYAAYAPERGSVHELFILTHGPENSLRRLAPAEAAGRILQTSFPPLWDREGMAWTLDFLDRLTASVPVYELTFHPDEAVVPFIRRAARGRRDDHQPD